MFSLSACIDTAPKVDCSNITKVQCAYEEKSLFLKDFLQQNGLDINNCQLFMRAFKYEKVLEIWAKKPADSKFQKVIEYDFCQLSGDLGPKRKEGDYQTPEGFYHINIFNPNSSLYLSLGINYPNKSDLVRSNKTTPGGDIFIHGKCMTIGCIPITDDKIKELYVLAEKAKGSGQSKIPVHIFPFKMTNKKLDSFSKSYPTHTSFWKEIQPGYLYFEKNKTLPSIDIKQDGSYFVKN